MTQHDLSGTHGFSGDTCIRLQADAKIWRCTTGPCATNNFVPGTQRNRGPSGPGEVLRTLGNCADSRLQIQFGRMNLNFLSRRNRAESRDWMCRVGNTKLSSKRERWHPGLFSVFSGKWIRNSTKQIAHEIVELVIGDEVCSLLMQQGSAQYAREPND